MTIESTPRKSVLTGTRGRKTARRVALFVVMVAAAVVMLYPFYYMLNNAFRTAAQFDQQVGHSVSSWGRLFQDLPVAQELFNSTLICSPYLLKVSSFKVVPFFNSEA